MYILIFCFTCTFVIVILGQRKERKSHDSRTKKHGLAADRVSLAKSIDSTDSSAKSTVSGSALDSEKPETHAKTEDAEVEVVDEEERRKLRLQLEEELASLDLKPKAKAKPLDIPQISRNENRDRSPKDNEQPEKVEIKSESQSNQEDAKEPEMSEANPSRELEQVEAVVSPASEVELDLSVQPPKNFDDFFFKSVEESESCKKSFNDNVIRESSVVSSELRTSHSEAVEGKAEAHEDATVETSHTETNDTPETTTDSNSQDSKHDPSTQSSLSAFSTHSEEESPFSLAVPREQVVKKKTPSPVKDPLRFADLLTAPTQREEKSFEEVIERDTRLASSNSLEVESEVLII